MLFKAKKPKIQVKEQRPKDKESLCGKRGLLKKGGGSMKQYDKTEE